ncbi:MAG: PDZ domain-containing protein [Planctomycetaceae bacterium]|jgi:serine protease Do|nr:PDZ domain-containing protein [Planctomycetaceae bacterium]MBT6483826.1 PDZ domain-containing protein [Planctomycetaceae bacterium]MBT6496705.1 PDZ domain-containing protein [Planctomycetaceae bacterium]
MQFPIKYRRSLFGFTLTVCAVLATGNAIAADAKTEALEEQAFKQAAALAAESVVRVQTIGGIDRVGQVLTGTGPTTGVIVSADGYIISSAFNFASKPASVLVQLPDGRRFSAETVATDRLKMLTLLKIDAKGLIPAVAAKKDSVKVGQWAVAMGRTFSLEYPSISVGIVSALNRIWGKAVQTDAKISPVNYGGPLVNIEGKTLGILVPLSTRGSGETAGVEWYDSGIGFAIPMQDVYTTLDRLKAGKDLQPGLMGINFRGRDLLGGKPILDRVRTESPADKVGFKSGDLIVTVNGKPVHRQAEVKQVLGSLYSDDTVTIAIKRDDKTIEKELTLVAELVAYESGFLGILPGRGPVGPATAGVEVRHIFPGSPAAMAGLKTRDRIMRFGETDITDAQSLLSLVSRLRPEEKTSLVFVRDDKEQTVQLELASIPDDVPAELTSSFIPVAKEDDAKDDKKPADKDDNTDADEEEGPKTGRFNVKMPNGEHSCWAYVPADYNPQYEYAVMVWIHPGGDTMEATVFKQWQAICDRRGIIILGPKAQQVSGFTPNEAEFVKDALEQMTEKYSIDTNRVFLHTYSNGGKFAYQLAFKYREQFHGVAAAAAPLRTRPPENDPDYRMQFHLLCGDKDSLFRNMQQTVGGLKRLKYPVNFTTMKGRAHKYPAEEETEEIGRWADCLDRI